MPRERLRLGMPQGMGRGRPAYHDHGQRSSGETDEKMGGDKWRSRVATEVVSVDQAVHLAWFGGAVHVFEIQTQQRRHRMARLGVGHQHVPRLSDQRPPPYVAERTLSNRHIVHLCITYISAPSASALRWRESEHARTDVAQHDEWIDPRGEAGRCGFGRPQCSPRDFFLRTYSSH